MSKEKSADGFELHSLPMEGVDARSITGSPTNERRGLLEHSSGPSDQYQEPAEVSGRKEGSDVSISLKDGRGPGGTVEGVPTLESKPEPRTFLERLSRRTSFGMTPQPGGGKQIKELTPIRRYYMVAVFTATASMLYADQNLMAPLLSPIAAEFGFNDEEKDRYLGGYVAALFFVFGAPSALLVGYLCDRMNRRNLLFIVVLLGEGPCLATYFVSHYWQLLVLRVLTGISVGGTLPLVYSLVGDLFDAHQRAPIAAAIQVATGVGLAMGQAISGFVGPHTGWRWPFVIVAVPAILLAALMMVTTTEPPRGASETTLQEQYENVDGYVYQEKMTLAKVGVLLSTPSNICVILQGLPGSLPWGVLLTFLNDFLYKDQHLSVPIATSIILLWGIGGGVGVIGGGFIGQLLYNRKAPLMPIFVGACVASAAFPIWFIINANLSAVNLFFAYAAAFLGGMLSSPPGPNARAVLLNVNEPESRGFALGLMTVLDDIGKGAGPFIVSLLITFFKGRRPAFNWAVGCWIPCGIIFACTAIRLTKDEAAMQERLRQKVLLQPVALSGDGDSPETIYAAPRTPQ